MTHKTIDFIDLSNLEVGSTLHSFINRIESQNADLIALLGKVQETSKQIKLSKTYAENLLKDDKQIKDEVWEINDSEMTDERAGLN